MRVFTLFLARRVRCEDVLDTLPGDFIDEGLVATGIANAAVRDFTFVVRGGQYFMERV